MSYDDEKSYGSAKYHGMKVGGIHRWTYPDGKWQERKVAPDRWEVGFTSLKRRDRRAPEGSGAEVGSGYHWLIVAHQWVDKLDANTYATRLEGTKYLVAFRKADWPVWNTQFRNAKRHAKERTLAALRDLVRRIEEGGDSLEEPVDAAALVDLAATFEAESGLARPLKADRGQPAAAATSPAGRTGAERTRTGRPQRQRARRRQAAKR
jgi:hypothetical protein